MIYRRQIREKEENEKLKRREVLEEGRAIKQKQEQYKRIMEDIKKEKVAEMNSLNVKSKYKVDLEKYKIK